MAHISPHSATLHNILLPNQFNSIRPRVVQPGGLSRIMRVRYTARRKLGLLASAKGIMEEEGVTLQEAARRLDVSHSLWWREARRRGTAQRRQRGGSSTDAAVVAAARQRDVGSSGTVRECADTHAFERHQRAGVRVFVLG